MGPMLVGIGPVLGEGVAGYFVEPDGTRREWGHTDGAAVLDGIPTLEVEAPYTLRRPATRIAVLTDEATVSSGEAIVVAFRGHAGTRSFGRPTCGRSSANDAFRLRNGALFILTVGLMADREGNVYGGRIEPDERVDGAEVVQRAIDWLMSPAAR